MKRLLQSEKYFSELPTHHRKLIPNFQEHLRNVKTAIEQNAEIIQLIVANTDHMFENKDHGPAKVSLNILSQFSQTACDLQ